MDIKLACTHQHSLTFRHGDKLWSDYSRLCESCGEQIPGDFYTCQRCNVSLHESCANKLQNLPDEISHPLHSKHQLKLQLHRPLSFICDKCTYISAGSRYKCSNSCNFVLDLECASSVDDPLTEEESRRFKEQGTKKKAIQHYSHNCKLRLFIYRKIKEEDYCHWCEKLFSDSDICCGCTSCRFFVHEVCINKIPRTLINHHFHPSHPLRLHQTNYTYCCDACGKNIWCSSETPAYWCQNCNFRIDFNCAKRLPTLKHNSHHHLLTYFKRIFTPNPKRLCNECHMICDTDHSYRCVQCNFNLHLQCVPIPSSAKHKYHRHQLMFMDSVKEDDSGEYYCDVCEDERNPKHPAYWCEECKFIVHIECIVHEDNMVSSSAPQSVDCKEMELNEGTSTDDSTSQQLLIQPLIHEHPLKFHQVTEENQYCNGCRLTLSGPSFICTRCPIPHTLIRGCEKKYCLHEKCTKLPYEIHHPSHSTHPLYLYSIYPHYFGRIAICHECREICQGFVYLCEECNFVLDVKCYFKGAEPGVSQLKLDDGMERQIELYHFTHPHKLILVNSNDPIHETECKICQLPILGPAYFCLTCTYYIVHESCLGFQQKMQLPFHSDHMFVIARPKSVTKCYACGLSFYGYFGYNCEECHDWLHTLCANSLRRPLEYYEAHYCRHNLYYFGKDCQKLFARDHDPPFFRCSKCGKNCRGQPFYRCLHCHINFHMKCVPIPLTVKSRCHLHPLTLKDSFIEDDSGEYYCDVCEEERYEKDHVYCCEQCDYRFVAHIECILAKVEAVLSYLDASESDYSYDDWSGVQYEGEEDSNSTGSDDNQSPPVQDKEEDDSTASRDLVEEQGTSSESAIDLDE